eukprot:jgi/Chlat1/2296/Chrsp17S02800
MPVSSRPPVREWHECQHCHRLCCCHAGFSASPLLLLLIYRIPKHQAEAAAGRGESNALRAALREAREGVAETARRTERVEEAFARTRAHLTDKEGELGRREAACERASARLRAQEENHARERDAALSERKLLLEQLARRDGEFVAEVDKSRRAGEALSRVAEELVLANKAAAAAAAAHAAEMRDAREAMRAEAERAGGMRAERDAARKEAAEAKGREEEAKAKADNAEKHNQKLETEITELQTHLQAANEQIDDLREAFDRADEEHRADAEHAAARRKGLEDQLAVLLLERAHRAEMMSNGGTSHSRPVSPRSPRGGGGDNYSPRSNNGSIPTRMLSPPPPTMSSPRSMRSPRGSFRGDEYAESGGELGYQHNINDVYSMERCFWRWRVVARESRAEQSRHAADAAAAMACDLSSELQTAKQNLARIRAAVHAYVYSNNNNLRANRGWAAAAWGRFAVGAAMLASTALAEGDNRGKSTTNVSSGEEHALMLLEEVSKDAREKEEEIARLRWEIEHAESIMEAWPAWCERVRACSALARAFLRWRVASLGLKGAALLQHIQELTTAATQNTVAAVANERQSELTNKHEALVAKHEELTARYTALLADVNRMSNGNGVRASDGRGGVNNADDALVMESLVAAKLLEFQNSVSQQLSFIRTKLEGTMAPAMQASSHVTPTPSPPLPPPPATLPPVASVIPELEARAGGLLRVCDELVRALGGVRVGLASTPIGLGVEVQPVPRITIPVSFDTSTMGTYAQHTQCHTAQHSAEPEHNHAPLSDNNHLPPAPTSRDASTVDTRTAPPRLHTHVQGDIVMHEDAGSQSFRRCCIGAQYARQLEEALKDKPHPLRVRWKL